MITLIRKTDFESLNKIYDDMTLQFPICERKTRDGFLKLFNDENYRVYEAVYEGDAVGYCVIYVCAGYSVLWLDYLAVYKDFHSKGYGGKILLALKDIFPDYSGCFLEVEKPDTTVVNTIRRINFYKRLGAVNTEMVYFYPNKDGCVDLDLYFLPFAGTFKADKKEIRKVVRHIFNTLYKDIEHIEKVFEKIK